MNYYLGFDGGGTKTESVVVDSADKVLGYGLAGPANPLRVGFRKAFASLQEAGARALAAAGVEVAHVRGVCAGLAGAARPHVLGRLRAFLQQQFPQAVAHGATDLEIALEAAAEFGPAVVLIAGTGSAAYGRNSFGQTARAGGWGRWIGDAGSAFEIGRQAVERAARARDGLVSPTGLGERILAGLGCPEWDTLTERIARRPDEIFPAVFPVVAEAASAGDDVAREILSRSAEALAELAGSVIGRLRLSTEEFILAKVGGAFQGSAELDAAVTRLLRKIAHRARIGPIPVSPAVGAARLARLKTSSPA